MYACTDIKKKRASWSNSPPDNVQMKALNQHAQHSIEETTLTINSLADEALLSLGKC